jgi:S-(hydroxymethyl)glutathione dehydrogenase / alcohol dehydrogenase
MKAAVQFEVPGRLEIVDIDIDQPRHNEVLIRVIASGLCHSDLHFLEGTYTPELPIVLGHEGAGIVEAVGEGVTGIAVGDHVATCLSTFCGSCEFCLSGRPALCTGGGLEREPDEPPRLSLNGSKVHAFSRLGAFAEKMLVHEHSVVPIRHDMPFDRASILGCAVTTGVGTVINSMRMPVGSTVAVIGCGGVGLNVIQGAILAGASRVIAVDKLASKLELARKFGATDTVDASETDAVEAVQSLVPGGVDFAVEAIGLTSTAQQAFSMAARGGTAVIVGLTPVGQDISIHGAEMVIYEKHLVGSYMGSNRFRIDIPRYIEFYMQGRLNLDDLVSRHITLEEVNEGYEALKRGEVARSVILFE